MRSPVLLTLAAVAALAVAACGRESGSADDVRAGSLAAPPDAPPAAVARAAGTPAATSSDLLHGPVTRLNGEPDDLAQYRGKVVLVVNTASECINTGQYGELEALYRARRGEGLVVLGFPANDFGGQEPGSDEEIAAFCERNYGVSFPMFAKGVVTGSRAMPLYRRLSAASQPPSWNFTKYLLDRRGRLVARYDPYLPADAPTLVRAIDRQLDRPARR